MKKNLLLLALLGTLLTVARAQVIPLGNYVNGSDYFSFLPEQRIQYHFTDEASFPNIYEGQGMYILSGSSIIIIPDMPKAKPDSAVKRTSREVLAGLVDIHVTGGDGPLKGITVTVSDADGRYIADEKTDNLGEATIRIPQQKYDVELTALGYKSVKISGAYSHYHYEVFMEKTTGYEDSETYLNTSKGGLPYKIAGNKFSITRKAYRCSDPQGCMEWFTYKSKS